MLYIINAHTKGKNPLTVTQVIVRKRNYVRTDKRTTDGRSDTRTPTWNKMNVYPLKKTTNFRRCLQILCVCVCVCVCVRARAGRTRVCVCVCVCTWGFNGAQSKPNFIKISFSREILNLINFGHHVYPKYSLILRFTVGLLKYWHVHFRLPFVIVSKIVEWVANIHIDQTPHSVTSDLGLHCLPMCVWLSDYVQKVLPFDLLNPIRNFEPSNK